MLQHADDLRAEIVKEGGDPALADAVLADWRGAPIEPVDAALCAYAEKLTREPAAMTEADLQPLRAAGLGDTAIHNAVQVIAFFNYINRVADAVHVELEPRDAALPRRIALTPGRIAGSVRFSLTPADDTEAAPSTLNDLFVTARVYCRNPALAIARVDRTAGAKVNPP